MDTNNKKCDKLAGHLAEKKVKIQSKVEASIKELYNTCRTLRCDPPIYFLENGKICVSLAGSYTFSKAPDFKSRNKINDNEKARLDVTQQALSWIEHNTPPSYYWKDIEAENAFADLASELVLGVYENDTSKEEVQKVMLYLEGKIMAKLGERIKSKKATALDPVKYKRALDIFRFSKALSAADTDQSQQTEADLSCQLRLNDATTSVPTTTTVSTNNGTIKSIYGKKVAAEVNEPISESDAPAPDNLDESASDYDTSARRFILRNSVVESRLPGMSIETVVEWMSGSFTNYCDYHNDHDIMHIVSTILSKDGDSFVAKVKELGASVPVKNVKSMELILQPYSPGIVERLWGSKGRQVSKGPGAYDLEQFLNICDGGLLPICDEISNELRGGAKVFLGLFLNWHRNDMISRVLSLSVHVGDRTQEFIDRLLKLQNTELLPLIDAVIAETDGKPVPLLKSFLRWNKNDVAQRFLDFDARGDVRSLLIDAEFNGKPDVFFHQLRKWQSNMSFQYLHRFDQVTSEKSPEFLHLALRMCETGLMRHTTENKELIGDRPCGLFNDMFEVSRLIVNGQAIVVARGEHGNFTRDLTPNLRPRLLSTSLSYELQSLPAWMESICGTGDGTDPSQLEFENVGSNELSKFVNFSLKLYNWGVHSWASDNLAFIGTDPALFFNQLFHLAAILENGSTSPGVLEAIAATQKIMPGTPGSVGTGGIDASTSSNLTSDVTSSLSNMVSQSLQPPPKPAFNFDWQSSNAGSKLSAPSSSSSSRKAKKTRHNSTQPSRYHGKTDPRSGKVYQMPSPWIQDISRWQNRLPRMQNRTLLIDTTIRIYLSSRYCTGFPIFIVP
ncbi:hypothetical protein BPAE_0021g00450 [Botrytis paeoniae]|uniref:Uncharacterized protein n=1 Tax=Botrytis paeoniae TaxID=278948 RepID=A0A4Z1G097_9HELO|nr:hypothetical protein BPAE_0021g00450 [Botrytis paeoniae]